MDWDEPKARSQQGFSIGEDVSKLSVVELEERIALMRAEIVRLEQAIATKKKTTAAAAALFGDT